MTTLRYYSGKDERGSSYRTPPLQAFVVFPNPVKHFVNSASVEPSKFSVLCRFECVNNYTVFYCLYFRTTTAMPTVTVCVPDVLLVGAPLKVFNTVVDFVEILVVNLILGICFLQESLSNYPVNFKVVGF